MTETFFIEIYEIFKEENQSKVCRFFFIRKVIFIREKRFHVNCKWLNTIIGWKWWPMKLIPKWRLLISERTKSF